MRGLMDPASRAIMSAGPGATAGEQAGSRSEMQKESSASQAIFVGRAAEISIIGELLDAAKRGRGQVVGLSGEPGIGKTRLAKKAVEMAMRPRLPRLLGKIPRGPVRPSLRSLEADHPGALRRARWIAHEVAAPGARGRPGAARAGSPASGARAAWARPSEARAGPRAPYRGDHGCAAGVLLAGAGADRAGQPALRRQAVPRAARGDRPGSRGVEAPGHRRVPPSSFHGQRTPGCHPGCPRRA